MLVGVRCLLFVVACSVCLRFVVCCVVFAICWSLFDVRCLSVRIVARLASCVVCCWLLDVVVCGVVVSVCDAFGVRCLLSVVRLLCVVGWCCLLSDVLCLMCAVR